MRVINMKSSRDILNSIIETTQMGRSGIQTVLDRQMNPALYQALISQLKEYEGIESGAKRLLKDRKLPAPKGKTAQIPGAKMMARARLATGNANSKIAGMMIQGNTRGMILGLRNMHQYSQADPDVSVLAQRLLDTETANIRQMKPYL